MQKLPARGRAGRRNQLGPVQRITVNLQIRDYRMLLAMCEETGREMSEIVRVALRKELAIFLASDATDGGQSSTDGNGEDAA